MTTSPCSLSSRNMDPPSSPPPVPVVSDAWHGSCHSPRCSPEWLASSGSCAPGGCVPLRRLLMASSHYTVLNSNATVSRPTRRLTCDPSHLWPRNSGRILLRLLRPRPNFHRSGENSSHVS